MNLLFTRCKGESPAAAWGLNAALVLLVLPVLLLFGTALGWLLGELLGWFAGHVPDNGLGFVLAGAAAQSLGLLMGVLALCAVLGTGLGWLMSQYQFPAKAVFEWLLMAPLAVPSFVAAHAWVGLLGYSGTIPTALRGAGWTYRLPDIHSAGGAAWVLGLALYPYVYTLARVAFAAAAQRRSGIRAAAASLGATDAESFWKVSLPLSTPALAAGLALVGMEALADYGAVAYLGVDTFTVSIYKTWFGADQRGAALGLVAALLAVVAGLLALQRRWQGKAQRFQVRTAAAQDAAPALHGAKAAAAFFACACVVGAAFVLPVGSLLWALAQDADTQLSAAQWLRMGQAAWHSVQVATLGTLVVMGLAVTTVVVAFISPLGRMGQALLGTARLGYAVPGVAIAMALLLPIAALDHAVAATLSALLGREVGLWLMGSMAVLVYAYALRFFAVAHGSVAQGAARLAPSSYVAALSLGATPWEAVRRIVWPALRPSVWAGGVLVWIDCLKELPATLMLRPFDFDTLPVLTYQWVADERAAQAALPSLMLVLVGLLPVWGLRRLAQSAA